MKRYSIEKNNIVYAVTIFADNKYLLNINNQGKISKLDLGSKTSAVNNLKKIGFSDFLNGWKEVKLK